MTTGALSLTSGYTTNACTDRVSCFSVTYSWCRGDASRRALAQSCARLAVAARKTNTKQKAAERRKFVMGWSLAAGEIDGQVNICHLNAMSGEPNNWSSKSQSGDTAASSTKPLHLSRVILRFGTPGAPIAFSAIGVTRPKDLHFAAPILKCATEPKPTPP